MSNRPLLDALIYPINYDSERDDVNETTVLNDITALKILKEFDDDHVACFEIEVVVNGDTYIYTDLWAGDHRAKMYYQSEISQDIRDARLKPYFLNKILDCTF